MNRLDISYLTTLICATLFLTQIASHAQKHFIHLYVDSLPLPAKVLESGSGYTLSGEHLEVVPCVRYHP